MIRAVLFDLDDTLVDFHPSEPRALFEAGAARVYAYLTARGCALPAFDPFCRRQRGIARRIQWLTWLRGGAPDGRWLFRRLCRDFGLQRDEISLARLGWLWYEPVMDTARPLADDVLPTLQALRDGGVKLGLVVNTKHHAAAVDRHLEALGLLGFFPVRAYSTELGARKPNPRPYQWALSQLGAVASESLFVGDDLKRDLLGARRIGMRTCLRTRHPRHPRHPRDLGDPHRPVPQVDFVIRRLGQLLEIFDVVPELSSAATAAATPAPTALTPLNVV